MLILIDLSLQIPFNFLELQYTVNTDMAFSSTEIASNKDGVIVVLISEIQIDFLISFESLWVELCCLQEALFIE